MMKTLMTMITISISTYMVSGQVVPTSQKYCEKTLAQSPAIQGLRLGMSETVAARQMGATFYAYPKERQYMREAMVWPENAPGVRYVLLRTFAGKLVEIEASYNVEWNSEDEFLKDFTRKLGLPANAWESEEETTQLRIARPKILSCKSFNVELLMIAIDRTSLALRDTGYREKIDYLKDQDKTNVKKTIKP